MQEMLRKSVSIMLVMLLLCTGLTAFATTTPDLTQDYVKTYVEQTNSVIAADSLLKTADTHPTNYRLTTTNDIAGNNGSQALCNTDWSNIVDWDGSVKNPSLILEKKATAGFAENSTGIAGTSFVKDAPGRRLWFDTSSLNDGDVLVVSMYAKTKEAGAAANFNMGYFIYENYALNAYTAEHGTEGVAISDQWTRFAGTITLPAGFKEANANVYYSIHFGYAGPKNESEVPTIYLSNAYVAKVKAVDIENKLDAAVVNTGDSVTATAKTLNQIGTAAGVTQDFDWYVTDESRTTVIKEGFTITEGTNGQAEIAVGKNVASGNYYVVAMNDQGWVKGAALNVVNTLTKNTLVVEGNGTVTVDGTTYQSGTHTLSNLNAGEQLNFTVTPAENYEATVIYNNVPLTNVSYVTIEKDATLSVTFTEIQRDPSITMPSVTAVQENYKDGYSARVFYFAVANAGNRDSFGMYLTKNREETPTELLIGENGINGVGQYGFRIYGEGVQNGTFYVKGFAKGGNETEITTEWSDEYSMTK